MKKKGQVITAIAPEVVSYFKLKLPTDFVDRKEMEMEKELDKALRLKIQGEAIEIFDNYPTEVMMGVLAVAHKVSPEMILRLRSGERILIFEHWDKPIIRSDDVKVICQPFKRKEAKKIIQELTIDLGSIWEKNNNKENSLQSIEKTIKEAKKLIKPAMVTTLMGPAPAVTFLIVQHLLYGLTGEVWYQENRKSSPIRII